jgi:hypothetical protein
VVTPWSIAGLATCGCLSVSLIVDDFAHQSQHTADNVAYYNFARLC